MRNMSFALTEQQVLQRTKSVTRRLGWLMLQPGHLVQPVLKGMGLKPGEKIVRLGSPIHIVSARREPLRRMLDDMGYGSRECVLEGFVKMHPVDFVEMFCKTHRNCTQNAIITRIEFAYTT
jgi:hypothetical protein